MADSVFLMGDHSNKPPVLFSEKLHKNALKMIEDWRLKQNTKMSKLIPFFETVVVDSLCNLAEMFLKGQTEVPGLNFEVAEYNIWALLYGGSGRTHLSFDGCGLETARLSDLARLRKFNKKALDRSNRTMDQLIDQARRRKPAEGFIQPSVGYYSIETDVPNGPKHIELEKSLVAAAYPKKLEVMVTRITNPSDLLKGINSLRTFIANNFATTNKAFSFVLNLMLYNWNEHYFTISERAKIELTNFAKKPKVDGSVVTVIAGKLGQNTITEEEITTLTDYVCSIKPKKEQAKLKEAINTLFGNQKSLSAGLAQDLAKQDKFGNRLLDLMLFGYSKQFLAQNFGSREQLVEEIHKLAPESLSPSAYIKDVALRWDGIKLVPSKTNSSGAKVRYEFNELQMFYLENQVFMTYIGLKGAPIAEERCYPADPREALAHLKALLKKIKPEQTDYEAGIYLKSLLKHHIDFSNTEWIGAFKEVNRHLYLESEFKTYFTSLENNILPLASTFRLVDYFFKVSKRVHPSDRKDDPETKRLKALLELSFKGITHLSAVLKQLSSETREKYLTWKNNPTAVGGRSNPKKGGNAPKPPTGMMDTNFILQLLLHFSLFGDRDFIKSVLSNSYYKLPTDKLNPDEFTRFDILLYDHAADLVAISNNQAEAELKYAQLVSSKILNMILSQSGDLLVGGLALAADADQNFSSKVKLSRLQNQAMISRLAISNNRLRSMHPKSNQTQLLNTLHNVARLVKRLGGAKGNANFEAFISDVYLVALSEPAIPSKIGGQQKLKAACTSFLQVLQSEFGTVDTLEESSFKLTQMLRHFSSNIVHLIEYIVNTYKADDDFARDFCNFLFQRLESVIQEEEKHAQENERQPELFKNFNMPVDHVPLLSFVKGKTFISPEDYMKLAIIAKKNTLEILVHLSPMDDRAKLDSLMGVAVSKTSKAKHENCNPDAFMRRFHKSLYPEMYVAMKMKGMNLLHLASIVRGYSLNDEYFQNVNFQVLFNLVGRLGLADFKRSYETFIRVRSEDTDQADKIFLFWALWNKDEKKLQVVKDILKTQDRVEQALQVADIEHFIDVEYTPSQRQQIIDLVNGKSTTTNPAAAFDSKPKPESDEALEEKCNEFLRIIESALLDKDYPEVYSNLKQFPGKSEKFRALPLNSGNPGVVEHTLSYYSEMYGDVHCLRKIWPHISNPKSLIEAATRMLKSNKRAQEQLAAEDDDSRVLVPRNRIATYALMIAAASGDEASVDPILAQISNNEDKCQVGAKLVQIFSDASNKQHQQEFFKPGPSKKILARASEFLTQQISSLNVKPEDQLTPALNFRQKADLILKMHEESPDKISKTASDPNWITSHEFKIPSSSGFKFSNKLVSECFSQKEGHLVFYKVCKAVLNLEQELANINSNFGKDFVAEVQTAYKTGSNSNFQVSSKSENSNAVPSVEIDLKAKRILASLRFNYKGKVCSVNALSKPHQSFFELKAIQFNLQQMNSDFEQTYGADIMDKVIEMHESPLRTKEIMLTVPYSKRKMLEGSFGVNPSEQTFLTSRAVIEYKKQKELKLLLSQVESDITLLTEQKDLWSVWASKLGAKNGKEWHENLYKSLPPNMVQPEATKAK